MQGRGSREDVPKYVCWIPARPGRRTSGPDRDGAVALAWVQRRARRARSVPHSLNIQQRLKMGIRKKFFDFHRPNKRKVVIKLDSGPAVDPKLAARYLNEISSTERALLLNGFGVSGSRGMLVTLSGVTRCAHSIGAQFSTSNGSSSFKWPVPFLVDERQHHRSLLPPLLSSLPVTPLLLDPSLSG